MIWLVLVVWLLGATVSVAGGAHYWLNSNGSDLELSDFILLLFLSLLVGPGGFLTGLLWYLIGRYEDRDPIVVFHARKDDK